ASLCWATVSLLGKRAKRGGEKGLRRDAPPAGGCYRSRAGDRGQRSEIMADSVPLRPPKCPRSGRNTVRHAAGMVSAIGSESCPSWAGTRNQRRGTDEQLQPIIVQAHPQLMADESRGHCVEHLAQREASGG